MDTDKTLEDLKASGLRITSVRKQIVSLLSGSASPISVADILTNIKANKTTIYREITVLLSKDFILEVDFGDRIKRYELASRDHHHHLICLKCKSVTDVDIADDFSEKEKLIASMEKFRVMRHNLEFFGLCVNCG